MNERIKTDANGRKYITHETSFADSCSVCPVCGSQTKGEKYMNPWIIESVITVTKEAAKRNGFRLEPASDNRIALMANKAPYAKDVLIVRFEDWVQAQIWFDGYEQQIMENRFLQANAAA